MVASKKMRNEKLTTKQFLIYHFYDFMLFTDLDNSYTRSHALGWLFNPALQLQTANILKVQLTYIVRSWRVRNSKNFHEIRKLTKTV